MINPINAIDIQSQPSTAENAIFSQIKRSGSEKEQLKKAATEFEAVFVTKMLTLMDKTVEKGGGIFGEEGGFMKNFKSLIFNEIGRDIAKNPATSIGFASQIYKQMENRVKG